MKVLSLSLSYVVIAVNHVPIRLYALLLLIRGVYVVLVYERKGCSVRVTCFTAAFFFHTVAKRCYMMEDALCLRTTSVNENAIVEV